MKSIHLICSHYFPENTAGANRMEALANVLSTENTVTVFSLTEKGVTATKTISTISSTLKIVYLNQSNYSSNNFFIRMLFETYYGFKLILLSKKENADSHIVSIPYLGLLFSSRLLLKKPIIDIRDLVWEYIPSNGFISNNIKHVLNFITRNCLKNNSHIVVTNGFAKSILSKNFNINNVHIAENGISTERFKSISNIKHTKINDPFTISYVGNIGTAQNLLTLVEAAKYLPEIKFKIIGGGNREKEISEYVIEHNITNIELLGKLNWNDLIKHYSTTSILYAQLTDDFSSAIPSKLYEYIATGIPIIYGGQGAVESFARKFDNFIVVPPNNYKSLLVSFKKMIVNYPVLTLKNKNGLEKSYLREKISKSYLPLIK